MHNASDTGGRPLAVRLTNVTKTFGSHTAVDGLSLEVPAGSVYGFIGPNGSGKTTTIRMILHIFHPDGGDIEVLGERSTRAANDRIGYLPEERGLYKKMTVRRVLAYYAALKGMNRRDAREAIGHWLAKMGLEKWADKKVEALSKGMAQKIQFISAVIAQPKLLILDEPFSGLDPVNLEVLRAAILEQRQQGATVIFSTHDMAMAEQMCDFIFMIYKGRKVLDGTLASIQASYGADTVRLRVDGGAESLRDLDGAQLVRDLGQIQEVRCTSDPQELLKALTARTRVHLFEVAKPSLHDIFIRIAAPDAQEVKRG
ncbi:MAG: ATP-binding cassette domain-containing protein [Verrucomicrobia bacterium]|nr:ATP-binding cassette domain-containing protein [Verrucomicrobiota bacterium]